MALFALDTSSHAARQMKHMKHVSQFLHSFPLALGSKAPQEPSGTKTNLVPVR